MILFFFTTGAIIIFIMISPFFICLWYRHGFRYIPLFLLKICHKHSLQIGDYKLWPGKAVVIDRTKEKFLLIHEVNGKLETLLLDLNVDQFTLVIETSKTANNGYRTEKLKLEIRHRNPVVFFNYNDSPLPEKGIRRIIEEFRQMTRTN